MKKILIAAFFLSFFSVMVFASQDQEIEAVKRPNVSGQFYSADSQALSGDIERFLNVAETAPFNEAIPMVIVPHAGYVYSGAVAAHGYKALSRNTYTTVIVVGLSHYTDVDGFAIWPEGAFQTPLGQVEVDAGFCRKLMEKNGKVISMPQAFEREHSLEVQLPFLQKTLEHFKLVPLLTGHPNLDNIRLLAESLNELIGERDDILLVISTDMSHYYPDETARRMDREALLAIEHLDAGRFWDGVLFKRIEMCNFTGVELALLYAKLRGLDNIRVLRYANSGDVTGDKKAVVGYCSVVFSKTQKGGNKMTNADNSHTAALLTKEEKGRLIKIAKEAIHEYVGKGKIPSLTEDDPRLSFEEGAFVTIHKKGKLRGCIGNIIGEGPLYQTVQNMAIASATQDPRFSPVTKDELKDIDIEISVLSKPKRVMDPDDIQMGVHGVIVSRGFNRGVFLPQVATETGWSREEFLSQLCSQKAGLPPNAWKDPQTVLEIFTAQVFNEKDAAQ